MIRKFDEKFPDLVVYDKPIRQLPSIEDPEDRNYDFDNMTLFVLSQREPGFIEKYCSREENQKRLNDLKNKMEKNPDLLMNVVLVLDKVLPMSYKAFCKLSLPEQLELLTRTEFNLSDEDKDLFDKVFNDLSTKYKTKGLNLNETESK